MALPKSNQQPDPELFSLLSPLKRTAEQKKMMRLRHEDPCPQRQPVPRPCPRGLSCCSTPRCSCPATPPRAGKSPGSCRRPRPVPREGGRAWLPRCQGRGTTCTFWSKPCLRTCHKCASAKAPRLASSVGLAWTSSWLLLDVSGVILGAAWVRKAWVRGKRTKSAERGAARQLTYLFEIKAPRARRWPVGTGRRTALHSTTLAS